ncbi:MAG TPA: PqqD family protein [Myxococcales bacterium]|nr:PqqD family protein [Myxococcales bacterium]
MVEILPLFPTPREGVASRLVDGVAVAVTPSDSTLHTFENDVATEIWQLADGRHSVAQIVDRITEAFDVERPQAERDVVEFVRLLDERGLVELEARPR